MKVAYDIVHRLPDKTERKITSVNNPAELDHWTEVPRFMGTWISKNRKLLRYGMGELHVRQRIIPAHITGFKITEENNQIICRLNIANHKDIGWIDLTADEIVGYDVLRRNRLWTALSFNLLAIELDDKQLAFDCMERYEKFVNEYKLEGVL